MADNATTPTPEQLEKAAQTAEVKELMKRYGLTRALVDTKTGETHFEKAHIESLECKDAKLAGYREIKA